MRHCDFKQVTKILIGLYEVGLVGLREAIKEVDASGLTEREAILDRLLEILSELNYIPESESGVYRRAVWREVLRTRGEDFRDFYSEAAVVVRGGPGEERDRFLETLRSVFGDFELTPIVEFADPEGEDPTPELLIRDHLIVRGCLPRRAFKAAVKKGISHW